MYKKIISSVFLLTILASVTFSTSIFDNKGFRKDYQKKISSQEIIHLESQENININKKWIVNFNKNFKLNDIFSMSIKKGSEYIPVNIKVLNNKQAEIAPVNDYDYNEDYSIIISLINGKYYKMNFTTINSSEGYINDFQYIENTIDNSIIITGYKGSKKNIKIPSSINGANVKAISDNAFASLSLSDVEIPDTVEKLGYRAFYDNHLTEVNIPNSVTNIGSSAFKYNDLKIIDIPNSVKYIGPAAFKYNDLIQVSLPNSIKTINPSTFKGNELTELVLPNSVITVGEYAFDSNNLTKLTLSNSLTKIGHGSFIDNSLEEVYIPDSVTFIDHWAFGRNNFQEITLPEGCSYASTIFGLKDPIVNFR